MIHDKSINSEQQDEELSSQEVVDIAGAGLASSPLGATAPKPKSLSRGVVDTVPDGGDGQ